MMYSRGDLHALVAADVAKENKKRRSFGLPELPVPSRRSIERWVKQTEGYSQVKRRYGATEADRRFMALRPGVTAARPGELVQIDANRLDLAVLDEATGLTVQSPWLVVAIDVRTRVVLSAVLGSQPPSIESLSALFRRMVRSHSSFFALEEEVPFQPFRPSGLPVTIVADNALENVGRSMQATCLANGINLMFSAVKTPHHKGIVERFFRTLNDRLLHSLPGGKPFTPQRRQQLELDPYKQACLTLTEAEALIERFVFCEYHNTPHSSLGRTPKAQWELDAAEHPLLRPASIREFEYSLGFQEFRKLDRRGVRLHGLRYNGPQTTHLLNDLLPLARGKSGQSSVKVAVRYLADDLSRIVIFNEVAKDYVSLPCVTPGFDEPIGLFAFEWLKKRMREEGLDPENDALIAQERANRIREVEVLKRDRKLKNRSQAQRLESLSGTARTREADGEEPAPYQLEGYLIAETASTLKGTNQRQPSKRTPKPRGRAAKAAKSSPQPSVSMSPSVAASSSQKVTADSQIDPVRQRYLERKASRGGS